MATNFSVVTDTTPANSAALAEYLINRYLDRTNNALARDLQKLAVNVGLGNGFLYPVLKTFSIQTTFDTASISAVLTAFKAWVPSAQQTDVNALITAIQAGLATHQGAHASFYTGLTPFDVWANTSLTPTLDAQLQTSITAASVSGSTVSLVAAGYISGVNDGGLAAQAVNYIESV